MSEWLRPSDLAAREGISPRTLRRWAEKGLVERRRLAPGLGVRVRLLSDDEVRAKLDAARPKRQNDFGELLDE